MLENILKNGDMLYKIGLNGKGQLTLVSAKGNIITSQSVISGHTCKVYSCDIDEFGIIHIASVMGDKLTYYRFDGEKTSTTHLMHLPEKFKITSLVLHAGENVYLYYCVESDEGCATIEYSLTKDGWQGKNLLTGREKTQVACGRKDGSECYAIRSYENENILTEIKSGKEVFSSRNQFNYIQAVRDGVVFCCGGYGYINGNELINTDNLYLSDSDVGYIFSENRIKEISVLDGTRIFGEATAPRDKKEYILCEKSSEKRIILSSPYPFLSSVVCNIAESGIAQEVYMHQRTIFLLQGEVRSLKNRVRKLEEIVKMWANSK